MLSRVGKRPVERSVEEVGSLRLCRLAGNELSLRARKSRRKQAESSHRMQGVEKSLAQLYPSWSMSV
jgi:hypothetical protein